MKDQNTKDHSVWTMKNGDPMHEVCIPVAVVNNKVPLFVYMLHEAVCGVAKDRKARCHLEWTKGMVIFHELCNI